MRRWPVDAGDEDALSAAAAASTPLKDTPTGHRHSAALLLKFRMSRQARDGHGSSFLDPIRPNPLL